MEPRRDLRRLRVLGGHLAPVLLAPLPACGIIAVVGGSGPAVDYVLEGLTVLQVGPASVSLTRSFSFFADASSSLRTAATTPPAW